VFVREKAGGLFGGRLVVAVMMAASLWGQDSTIRSNARLVEVNVVVRDKKGPVVGLTKGDFTVQDEGKAQTIAVFSVTSASGVLGSRAAEGSPKVGDGPGISSNMPSPNIPTNATILLIDRLNTPIADQLYVNQRIIKFLQTRKKKDPVGIAVLAMSLRMVQDLTDDAGRLERAVKGLRPQDGRRVTGETSVDPTNDAQTDAMIARSLEELQNFVVTDRAQTTSAALIAIAQRLKNVPGRKNLVWVSGSFPLFTVQAHGTLNLSDDVVRAGRALTDANVAVYPVDARGLSGAFLTAEQSGQATGSCLKTGEPCVPPPGRGGPTGIDTMNTLAGLTGGEAFYNTNGIDDSIERATDDAEVTYTLGFYAADEPDGTFHRLTVKVAAKGKDVRFRRGYYAAK